MFIASELSKGKHIFLIQEPYLHKGSVVGMPRGYQAFFKEKNSRAVILAHESLRLAFVQSFQVLTLQFA